MKDLHSHILYGIDDGSKTLDESIAILRQAYDNGVTDIVLTPHYIKNSKYNATNQEKRKILRELKKELVNNNININLYLGNEVYITDESISLRKEISTINNSRYILIELPLNIKYTLVEEVISKLKDKKLIPVIAHPERYIAYYKDYNFFNKLIKMGCLLQGNVGSIYGRYGKKSKKMIIELLKRDMICCFGSDIHHSSDNIYSKNIYESLFKIVRSKRKVDILLNRNVELILNDKDVIRSEEMNESSMLDLENNVGVSRASVTRKIRRLCYFGSKRLFDIICSLIGLIIISPIFILIGILIRLEDGKAPIFKQERIGKNGKVFKLYKFRSMVPHADDILKEMLKDPKIKKEYKKNMKLANDPRITKVGNILRKTSLDELPQLINVLKGDMSLIGNRPYLPREKEDMGEYYQDIIKSKPGITGYWQVKGRSNITFKDRLKLERFYSNNMCLKMDIKIFFLTFYVVLFGKGAE